MIAEAVDREKEQRIRVYPCHTNRASELGHDCTRYLTFSRTRWEEKALPDVGLQYVFDMGNMIERETLRDLMDAGLTVIEQQRPFSWDKYQITGHIDGKVMIDGAAVPLEIKSISPYLFDGIKSVEEMTRSKYPHLRRYPAQMVLYLLMGNAERGLMLFRNKSTGRLKEVWVSLDYDLGESLIRKAEEINAHVAAGTVPDPIEWDDDMCGRCGFLHVCTPDRMSQGVEVIDDEELRDLLTKWDSLKATAKEWEEVDELLKRKLQGRDKLLIGDFYITGSWRKRQTFEIPENLRAQYAKETRFWVRKIAKT